MQILLFYSSNCTDCQELGAFIDKYEGMSTNINFIPVDSVDVKNVIGGKIYHVPALSFVKDQKLTNIIQDKASVSNFIENMSKDFRLIEEEPLEKEENSETKEETGKTSISNLFN